LTEYGSAPENENPISLLASSIRRDTESRASTIEARSGDTTPGASFRAALEMTAPHSSTSARCLRERLLSSNLANQSIYSLGRLVEVKLATAMPARQTESAAQLARTRIMTSCLDFPASGSPMRWEKQPQSGASRKNMREP